MKEVGIAVRVVSDGVVVPLVLLLVVEVRGAVSALWNRGRKISSQWIVMSCCFAILMISL